MIDEDQRLKELFALDQPLASDSIFVLETLRRVQARQIWFELGGAGVKVCATCALLWTLAPCLESLSRPTASLLSALAPAVSLAVGAFFLVSPRASAAWA